jgi:diguanylate cyclase (GGDEF)-like protein
MSKQNALRRVETIRGMDEDDGNVPTRGLVITFLALSATCAVYLLWPESANRFVGLVWIFSLIPIFLLSYYRGWKGTTLAAIATMIAFASAEAVSLVVFDQAIDWWLYGIVVLLLLVISIFVGWLSDRLIKERREAIRMAFRDPLTRLPSRRALEFFLLKQVEAAHRGDVFSVVLFDLDNFKWFNDTYGHNAGDDILRRVGEVFIEYGREGDLTGRYGGEEFLTVLPGEQEEGAKIYAERIRSKMEELDLSYPDSPTVSAGVASWNGQVSGKEQLMEQADEALYRSKTGGRNMVTAWSEGMDT